MVKWLSDDDNLFLLDNIDFNLASWYAVVLSTSFWAVTYFAVRYTFTNKSPEWCIRIVALFHGLGSVIRGIPECIQENGEWVFDNPDEDSTSNQKFILVISLGYFVFDLGWCLAYETETNLMIFHHIYSCIALYRVLVSEISGGQTACGLGGMEITNPFLQLRWFLRSEGYNNTPVFKCVEVTFIVLFFVVRVVIGTLLFFVIISNSANSYEQKFYSAMIYILSCLFFANIIKFVHLKYVQNTQHRLNIGTTT